MPHDEQGRVPGQKERAPEAALHAFAQDGVAFAVGIGVAVFVRVAARRDVGHALADFRIEHAFAVSGPDFVKLLESHGVRAGAFNQQRGRCFVGAQAGGGEHPVDAPVAHVPGQGFGLGAAQGRERGIAADAALHVEFRLAVAGQVKAVHPDADHNLADGRIIGRAFAGAFVQNAVGRGIHAEPEFFILKRAVDGFIIADALHEAVQGVGLAVGRVFGQRGFAADAGVEQQRVFVDALHKEHGVVGEGLFDENPPGAAGVGGVQNGHLALFGQPGPGSGHVAEADLLADFAARAVFRIVEIRLRGFRAHQGPAHVAVVEDLRPDALGQQALADAPRQRGLAARGQAHHRHVQFPHIPLRCGSW